MIARCAAAAFAGVALLACVSGAYSSLTTLRAWCAWCVAVFAAGTVRDVKTLACFAAGVGAGCALPHAAPRPAGDVVTHAPKAGYSGDLFALLDRIDRDPAGVIGERVSVSGTWGAAAADQPATVSRRIMSCCAADAVAVGFDVVPKRRVSIGRAAWVRVTGILRSRLADGEIRYLLAAATVCRLPNGAPKARSARPPRGPAAKLSATPCE